MTTFRMTENELEAIKIDLQKSILPDLVASIQDLANTQIAQIEPPAELFTNKSLSDIETSLSTFREDLYQTLQHHIRHALSDMLTDSIREGAQPLTDIAIHVESDTFTANVEAVKEEEIRTVQDQMNSEVERRATLLGIAKRMQATEINKVLASIEWGLSHAEVAAQQALTEDLVALIREEYPEPLQIKEASGEDTPPDLSPEKKSELTEKDHRYARKLYKRGHTLDHILSELSYYEDPVLDEIKELCQNIEELTINEMTRSLIKATAGTPAEIAAQLNLREEAVLTILS